MIRFTRIAYFLLLTLFCGSAISAQQNTPPTEHPLGRIFLDVVVTGKSGLPQAGLQEDDFTLLDNKDPQTITSFKAVSARETDQSVILVADAVNTSVEPFMYARAEIGKFLRADEGHLAYPTALATLTDKGIRPEVNFSTDGNALAAALDRSSVSRRGSNLATSAGANGQAERVGLSMQALDRIAASAARAPGRKLMIWVSPGWPFVEAQLDPKRQRLIFDELVLVSDDLLKAHVILYSVNPLGASDTLFGDSYYKQYLKGVSKPNQVQFGNLALQVLAVQSGGLALPPSNDVARMVRECVNASAPYYEISFDPPPSKRAGEYHRLELKLAGTDLIARHHLEIKLAETDLTARTLQGYYAQP
jgi:VWFA-related protein